MSGFRMWAFEYDGYACKRGFEMEKFHFSQEDWREYEKGYPIHHERVSAGYDNPRLRPGKETIEDWREHEKDYGYQEDTEPPTERVDDRRSYDWVDQLNQEMEETSLTDIDIDVILG